VRTRPRAAELPAANSLHQEELDPEYRQDVDVDDVVRGFLEVSKERANGREAPRR